MVTCLRRDRLHNILSAYWATIIKAKPIRLLNEEDRS